MMHARFENGFTLVELMIVVVILGILAAFAWPQYQNYVISSQISVGLAEITTARTSFDEAVRNNNTPSVVPASNGYIGLPAATPRCNPVAVLAFDAAAGTGAIRCTFQAGNPAINGQFIEVIRAANGRWTCETNVAPRFIPQGCAAPVL